MFINSFTHAPEPESLELPMLLVLDNYDSFTYNLVQYLGELGEQPVVKRNDEITVDEIGAMGVTRLVISPGPCTPSEAGITVAAIKKWGGQSRRWECVSDIRQSARHMAARWCGHVH